MNYHSGDVVLFKENYFISKYIIKPFSRSDITHVGIILNKYEKVNGVIEKISYCLESHPLNFNFDNNISRLINGGVFITKMDKRLESSSGDIIIYRLNKNIEDLNFEYNNERFNGNELIWKFYELNKNKKYEYFFPLNTFSSKFDDSKYFCSELVCRIYKLLGIVPDIIEENKVTPASFERWKQKMENGIIIFNGGFNFVKEPYIINKEF